MSAIRAGWWARLLALIGCALVMLGGPALAQGEPRWALVIGNNDYRHIGKLGTAVSDARAMAATLGELGFEVIERPDATRAGMYRAARELAERAAGAVAVVYYAGHGVQVGGRNYLLPVDLDARSVADVEDNAVPVDDVLNLLAGARAKLTVAFIDACRDNPLPPSVRAVARGMAEQTRVPRGLMVVYSAGQGEQALDNLGPGDRDPNGLFVRELMLELRRPGVALDAAAERVAQRALALNHDQNPAIYKAYRGKFYLKPGPAAPPVKPAPPPPRSDQGGGGAFDPRQLELAFWDDIKDSREPEDFRAYLDRFGEAGAFAPLARRRLAALQPPTAPPQPQPPAPVAEAAPAEVEAALGLSREDWVGLQRALGALGFDAGAADGRPGAGTRRAITAWQEAKGQEQTSFLVRLQRDLILSEAQPRLAALAPPPAPALGPASRAEPAVGVFGDAARKPGDAFRDCPECPEMVVVPAGEFTMGSPEGEEGRGTDEGPQRRVTIARPFALGRYEVTFDEWDACVADGGCGGYRPEDAGWGRGRRPAINISWEDAEAYVRWLSAETGEDYRLPSEAEWEHAARAGTATPFWWGSTISTTQANYDGNYTYGAGTKGEYRQRTVPVDAAGLPANPFGLYHVHGNVWEWVEDCYHDTYQGASSDGSAWIEEGCPLRVLRGGSWVDSPRNLRAANRVWLAPGARISYSGFRVARTFTP